MIGALLGLVGGTAVAAGGVWLAGRMLGLERRRRSPSCAPDLLIPAVVVALTTWAAAWAGSRRVLTVTPLQALGGSVEASHDAVARRTGRNVAALVLFIVGGALLALGILAGLFTPLGVVVAFVGGILSFTGLALGATLVMPPVLRLVGRLFGGSATARLAAENALRYPERSSRMAIGVVMGVTLVTMFAVAIESTKAVMTAAAGGELPAELGAVLDSFAAIMMGLVAVSAVIAGVGLVNLLTIGVVQRRRELGLLRALGVSNGQVRRMVLLEAAHITIAATATGLVLGVLYGWAGAQSLLGSIPTNPDAPIVGRSCGRRCRCGRWWRSSSRRPCSPSSRPSCRRASRRASRRWRRSPSEPPMTDAAGAGVAPRHPSIRRAGCRRVELARPAAPRDRLAPAVVVLHRAVGAEPVALIERPRSGVVVEDPEGCRGPPIAASSSACPAPEP